VKTHTSPWFLAALLVLSGGALVGRAWGEPPHPHEPDFVPEGEPHSSDERPPEERTPAEEPLERRKVQLQDGMLRIPGGVFSMGYEGTSPGEPNERPVHVVKLAPFWIDRTEVTAEDMRACVDRGDCPLRLGKGPNCTVDRSEPKLPINCVSWQSADAYCRVVGKRLPTEAEWELAAGGGQKARYPWGSAPASCALTVTLVSNRSGVSCSPRGPAPVGSHPKGASVFGVEDMSGNVEEWVADWYADRYELVAPLSSPGGLHPSPAGPAFGVAHVLRGGGWMSRPRETRVTTRSWGSTNEAGSNVGFRCAKD
jgi:formylglycine-generating enzyme required for sulfatase activity